MATVNFLYRSKKERAPLSLRLLYTIDGIDYVWAANSKEEVSKEYWKKRLQGTKDNNILTYRAEVNIKLQYLRDHILKHFHKTDKSKVGKHWLIQVVHEYYNPPQPDYVDERVLYWINHIINTAATRENAKKGIGLSQSRINSYNNLLKIFTRYQKKNEYLIHQLDKAWFDSFRSWLLESEKYSVTYTNKKVSDLKTVCKEAKSKVDVARDLDKVSSSKGTAYDEDMDVIYLSFEDLEKIEKAELNNPALENARKYLILSCYTGQRGKDLIDRIIPDNFKKRGAHYVIKFIQKKVNKSVTIPVLPKVLEIYENGLPYRVSIQKLNKHFKTVCKLAGIDEMIMGRLRDKETGRGLKKLRPKWQYIGTHSGRRSFASNHYGKLPTPLIMAVTNHKKESSFLTYLNTDNEDHVDMFMDYYAKMELKAKKQSNLTVVKNAANGK
ncbi:phage integrase SAM-like domain-containing protein [Arenibacter sp. GZD96]|uniref:phage integrase SAM-like domain-containing protein n=1 Tax=Aurantibrevibacter litoralis TaxID=3106030 RepID=UPI002B000AF5|nr:phage integrase SAM-like domain-containing protein [Arenibacter sp. GZD-96]MEA1784736.1 phage integrase SAM-like domain-containing protein [Arenibacter sp. GZD-96]